MNKILKGLLTMTAAISLIACGETKQEQNEPHTDPIQQQEELLKEKQGVEVPSFEVYVNGVKITEETMKKYPIYEACITTTNSTGTTKETKFIGYKLTDAVKEANINGTSGKILATASDRYEVTWEKGLNENILLALYKNDNPLKKTYPWFVPCDSATTGDTVDNCKNIVIDGLEIVNNGNQEDDQTLAEPDKQDKTGKVTFSDYSFLVDGVTVTNADLEGLSIYKIAVEVVNSKGNKKSCTYAGYLLKDVLEKLGKTPSSITIVADDGYSVDMGGGMVKNEYTLLAIECDKQTGENGTIWIAPCSSHDSKSYAKSVVEIKTNN